MTIDFKIQPLQPRHAREAAEIHAESQPGTFLTALGPGFLRVLYAALADSPYAYAYEAMVGDEVAGVAAGSTDTGDLLRDVVRRRWPALTVAVGIRLLTHPRLIPQVFQMLRYPNQLHNEPGEGEALVLGVRKAYRKHGMGSLLMEAVFAGGRERGVRALWYTVDGRNEYAMKFHQRQGAIYKRSEILFGREMKLFLKPLVAGDAAPAPGDEQATR